MIFKTLILSLLIKWYFQSSTQLDKESLCIPFFFLFLSLHKLFRLNIWSSPILQLITTCTPVIPIWSCHHFLSGFYQCLPIGLRSMFVNFRTHSQYFIYSAHPSSTFCHSKSEVFLMISNVSMVRINYFLSNPTLY